MHITLHNGSTYFIDELGHMYFKTRYKLCRLSSLMKATVLVQLLKENYEQS